MNAKQILSRSVDGEYYISPNGWIIKTSNEGDGNFIDPKAKTVKWTGHNGSNLTDEELAATFEKMEYLKVVYPPPKKAKLSRMN